MSNIKLTAKQLSLISTFINEGKPFHLSVRRSFARSHSNTIDLKNEDSRVSLREIRPRRYDGKKDIQLRTKETVDTISATIRNKFPDAPYEGVVYLTEAQNGE